MQRPPSFRLSLLISVAGIMALSGCDTSNLADKISGREGRKEQMVDGPRRAPLLNPQQGMTPPAMPPQRPDAAPKPQAAADSPFDQFDESGRMVAPQPAKPLEMASGEEAGAVDSGFFDRLIPDRTPETPAAEAKKAPEKPIRKPFIANVLSAGDEEETLALSSEPSAKAKPVVQPAPEAEPVFEPIMEPAAAPKAEPVKPAVALTSTEERDTVSGFVPLIAPPAEDKPVVVAEPSKAAPEVPAVAEEPAAASKPSLLSRLIAPVAGDKSESTASGEDSAAKAEPYPDLSSVPPTPETFKAIKDARDEQVETLTSDHAKAKEQKEALAEEPSELAPPSMLVSPVIPTQQVKEPAAVAASKPQPKETLLLGRISDPKLAVNGEETTTQAKPAPVEYKEDKLVEPVSPQPAPVSTVKPEPIKTAAEPSQETQQTPWWKRLGVFGDQPAGDHEPAAQQTSEQFKKPLVVEEPVTTVEPFKPLVETAPVKTRITPMIEPAKAAAVETAPQDENQEEDAAGNAEPAADKPAQVKTLPPSRYAPPRQRNYYLVP